MTSTTRWAVILDLTNLAFLKMAPTQPLHVSPAEIRQAAERSADLTRQLLAFARKQTIAPKVLDVNEAVVGTLNMLQRLIGKNIHLTWRPAANPWPVKVDPSQIDQALANLCVNARDGITDVGKIIIERKEPVVRRELLCLSLGCFACRICAARCERRRQRPRACHSLRHRQVDNGFINVYTGLGCNVICHSMRAIPAT